MSGDPRAVDAYLTEQKPDMVLVHGDTTERPEAVAMGTVKLVGTDSDAIVSNVSTLMTDRASYEQMANAVNPYGDGRASLRIVDLLMKNCRTGKA